MPVIGICVGPTVLAYEASRKIRQTARAPKHHLFFNLLTPFKLFSDLTVFRALIFTKLQLVSRPFFPLLIK